jgi:SH3-like domain-containing protein
MFRPDLEPMLVVRAYHARYAEPISVTRGEEVRVEREDDEYRGWWWCVAANGRAGWVPAGLFERTPAPGETGRLRAAYTSQELSVEEGTPVRVVEARARWVFAQTFDGRAGWLPASHLDEAPR